MRRRVARLGVSFVLLVLIMAAGGTTAHAQAGASAIPHLLQHGKATQLIVDGAPYLILGGELGNSTASSVAGMEPIWPKLRAMHLNTLLAPVYWELIEPEEGRYEFVSVDSLILAARSNGMHLVLLWFGSWKNSMSSYVPTYVKTNQARFPRTESIRGTGQEILSPFAAANSDADVRVFRALMRHLRAFDGTRHTVLMIQVENEIGMIPTARDHSALADSLFAQPVPAGLMSYLARHRDALAPELRALWRRSADSLRSPPASAWEDVFGPGLRTDELFMAWYFARYAERVVAAGKAEYPLPMYVNAALIRPGYEPGRYVSAGPLPHLIDVWHAGAPSIDFLSPDIYFPNLTEWTARYARADNPLFIPENGLGAQAAVNALYAFGAHDAIGYSPFAIESADAKSEAALARSYALLDQLAPMILANQGRGTMTGVMPHTAFNGGVDDSPQRVSLGDYTLTVSFQSPHDTAARPRTAGGLIVAMGPDEYVIAGSGLTVTFAPNGPGASIAGILRAQAGHYANGLWIVDRWLNGDQTHQGRHVQLGADDFSIQRVTLYRYR